MDGEKQVADSGVTPRPAPNPTEELATLGIDRAIVDVLQQVPGALRPVSYRAGDTLYNESSANDTLYVIRDGVIKLLSYLPDGRVRIVRLHKRGNMIGLNGLLDEVHEHAAIAVNEVDVYQIPLDLLRPLRERDPLVYSRLLENWNSYLNTADTWITEFSTGPIRARVARLLQFLVDLDDDSGPRELMLLSCEEMAEVLGVTPESVSRVLADYKRKRILTEYPDGDVERFHCDLAALAEEAGE